jgi:hypothetical protein
MASLMLGPLLRYVAEDCAVFWVETDTACEVEVLGTTEPTFEIAGHHYALVRAGDLKPGTWHEYEVLLDGERAWPDPDSGWPASAFRTYPKGAPLEIMFGSCRVCAPHEPPWTLTKDEDSKGREIDALHSLALRMREQPRDDWPDLLLMIGDQVYADEVSPETATFIDSRRDTSEPPGTHVLDFEEYTRLYREAWGEPSIRWLLSTVSSAMVFDDHDVHDDWNISAAWVEHMREMDWWDDHVVAAFSSYWLYQHLGNLSPELQDEDELYRSVRSAEGDADHVLREFALRADRATDGSRWSYCRDLGDTRLMVIDSRAGRVLDEDGRRMVDEEEWDWITAHATGGFDHLLIATSLPWLLAPGMHYFEAWNEAVCGGAWGERAAAAGEKVRQTLDLEHWSAFRASFDQLAELQRSVAAGERGPAPASIVTLSGDVHHAYLCEVAFPRGSQLQSAVWQAVCSPFRNPLNEKEEHEIVAGWSSVARDVARLLARSAGVPDPPVRWRLAHERPFFDNQVATLVVDGRRIDLRLEKTLAGGGDRGDPRLESVLERRLA